MDRFVGPTQSAMLIAPRTESCTRGISMLDLSSGSGAVGIGAAWTSELTSSLGQLDVRDSLAHARKADALFIRCDGKRRGGEQGECAWPKHGSVRSVDV